MATIDLVFEGGGAKGMVFVGALGVLLRDGKHQAGRLLGTSAGAITAVMLAAGYTPERMLQVLAAKGADGRSDFAAFLAEPEPFDRAAVSASAIRKALTEINVPFVPDFAENRIDDWLTGEIAQNPDTRHFFSLVERGGWYSATPFVTWLERMLDQGLAHGEPRQMGKLTLKEFYAATGFDMTLVAADTTAARMLMLNHRTAPDCPVVWAARMSMSIPLLWQEVTWQQGWGTYSSWNAATNSLIENDLTGHAIVDGGMLSNFPIALFLASRPDVQAVIGPVSTGNVLGLLIDATLPVPNRPATPPRAPGFDWAGLRMVTRLQHLINTATNAHDNMAIAVFADHVVHLPAAGYGTTQFDMTDAERAALVDAGRTAMEAFLALHPVPEAPAGPAVSFGVPSPTTALANAAAASILQR